MKRISVIIFSISVFAIGSFLDAKYYIPSCEPDGKVMGSKWKDWIVLPGEAFMHSEEYVFYNDVSFNNRIKDDYSVIIKVPNSSNVSDKDKFWQICYGSWEDPYRLSACVNIPVYNNEIEYRLTAQPPQSSAWACGFLYVVLYQTSDGNPYNGDNNTVEGSLCKTLEDMHELKPTISYTAAGLDVPYLFLDAFRIKPEYEPGHNYANASIPEKPKYVTATLMSMSHDSIPFVRVIVSYKFPDCDSVQTHYTEITDLSKSGKVKTKEIGPFLWIKPVSKFSYRYGEFTVEMLPYWKNPVGTEYEVIHPFPFYINGSAEAMLHKGVGTFYSSDEVDD